MGYKAMAILMVGGSRFNAPEALKEEAKQDVGALSRAGLEPRQAHHSRMMPLGLVPGV